MIASTSLKLKRCSKTCNRAPEALRYNEETCWPIQTSGKQNMLHPMDSVIMLAVAVVVFGPNLPPPGSGAVARSPLLDSQVVRWLAKSFNLIDKGPK